MTTWLWIIGIIAVVWPVMVALFLQAEVNRGFSHEASCRLDLNAALRTAESHILSLQSIVEEQDQLIAALWEKSYGYHASENEYFIYSWDLHPAEAYGVRPRWTIRVHEDCDRIEKLSHNGEYPWNRQL